MIQSIRRDESIRKSDETADSLNEMIVKLLEIEHLQNIILIDKEGRSEW